MASLEIAEDGTPGRVPCFGRGQIEGRVKIERRAEFPATLAFTAANAVHESPIFMRLGLILPHSEAERQGSIELFCRHLVVAVLIAGNSAGEFLLRRVEQWRHGLGFPGGRRILLFDFSAGASAEQKNENEQIKAAAKQGSA